MKIVRVSTSGFGDCLRFRTSTL